jgi:hypothetical protein
MCLKRKDQTFEPELIQRMAEMGNDDGSGYMYVEGERNEQGKLLRPGRIITDHTMAPPKDLPAWYAKVMNNNIAVHTRNATLGDVSLENCQPFMVLSKDLGHKADIAVMHNGTIRDVQVEKRWSDTKNFAEKFLRRVLEPRPSMLYEPGFIYFLCGILSGNKLIFLDDRERFVVINEDLGSFHPSGVWMSTKFEVKVQAVTAPFVPAHSPTTPTTDSSSSLGSGGQGKVSWKFAIGTWELDKDGRSHFHPVLSPKNQSGAEAEATDGETIEATTNSGISEQPRQDEEIDGEGLATLQKNLPAMDQKEIHDFVCESPFEAAHLLVILGKDSPHYKYNFQDAYKMALTDQWQVVNALTHITRVEAKVHEVN